MFQNYLVVVVVGMEWDGAGEAKAVDMAVRSVVAVTFMARSRRPVAFPTARGDGTPFQETGQSSLGRHLSFERACDVSAIACCFRRMFFENGRRGDEIFA